MARKMVMKHKRGVNMRRSDIGDVWRYVRCEENGKAGWE